MYNFTEYLEMRIQYVKKNSAFLSYKLHNVACEMKVSEWKLEQSMVRQIFFVVFLIMNVLKKRRFFITNIFLVYFIVRI